MFRSKTTYFLDQTNAEQAKAVLLTLVEAEMDISPEEELERRHSSSSSEPAPDLEDVSGTIISQIRKRIRLEKQQKVRMIDHDDNLCSLYCPSG